MTQAACVKRSGLWSIPARTMALASVGVYGANGDDRVFAFAANGDAGAGDEPACHRAVHFNLSSSAPPCRCCFGARPPIALPPRAPDAVFVSFIGCSGLLALCSNGAQLLTLRALQGVVPAVRRSSRVSSCGITGAVTSWRDGCRCSPSLYHRAGRRPVRRRPAQPIFTLADGLRPDGRHRFGHSGVDGDAAAGGRARSWATSGDGGHLLRRPAAAGIFGRPASVGWVLPPR